MIVSYQFTLPGTRCTVKLVQPSFNRKNKGHLDADGNPKEDFLLMHEHIEDVTTKMLKCTGKSRRKATVGGVSRVYPPNGAAMNTRDYVARFHMLNSDYRNLIGNFEPLSTRTQEWPSEPVEETIE